MNQEKTDPMWCFENYALAAETIDALEARVSELERQLEQARAVYQRQSGVLVPVEPTPEMVSAAEDAHMPFGDMDIAPRMAILSAPSAPATVQPTATNDQIAKVLLRHGTPEQQAEAARYAGISPPPVQGVNVQLLEALEGMVEYFPEGASDGECFSVDAARAAIAAARKGEGK